jgi:hypothetical protein
MYHLNTELDVSSSELDSLQLIFFVHVTVQFPRPINSERVDDLGRTCDTLDDLASNCCKLQ